MNAITFTPEVREGILWRISQQRRYGMVGLAESQAYISAVRAVPEGATVTEDDPAWDAVDFLCLNPDSLPDDM
jgi:hypothetical protein